MTKQLNRLRPLSPGMHGPGDDGSAVIVWVLYARRSPLALRVGLRGCNGGQPRPPRSGCLVGVDRQLLGFTPRRAEVGEGESRAAASIETRQPSIQPQREVR